MSSEKISVHVREQDGKARISTREAVLLAGRAPDGTELADTFKAGELILGALGSCILGTVRAYAKNHGITGLQEVQVEVLGEEAAAPARIARVKVALALAGDLSEKDELRLHRAAGACKIHNTLSRGLEIQISEPRQAAVA